jgi:hypothetical protein
MAIIGCCGISRRVTGLGDGFPNNELLVILIKSTSRELFNKSELQRTWVIPIRLL